MRGEVIQKRKVMPPKIAPGKNAPTKNPPSRGPQPKNAPTRGVKGGTGKKAKEKPKEKKLKLKRWLETKADWAKFDAWAKINAQPRKIPEPEPVVRVSKPLSKMKKRIAILSTPHKQPDTSQTCRADLRVSKKALKAKPSKRIIELAMFVVKNFEPCRDTKISRAALRYKPTKRILEISRPHEFRISDYCKSFVSSKPDEQTNLRARRLALAKKAIECPNLMTDEELNILMTPTGIYRSALTYKFTPWMTYLALPSYRFLKPQTNEQAEKWKKFILHENEIRGKKALEYKRNREEENNRKEERKRLEKKADDVKIDEKEEETVAVDVEKDENNENENLATEENLEKRENANNEIAGNDGDNADALARNDGNEDGTMKNEETAEEDEATKRRRAERNAWRFAPLPCKDDPFEIKRSALKGKVSPRMEELAKPHVHKNKSCRKKPFEVRKSALNGPVPERMSELAKPNHPRDPVEKPPPRDKDSFGRPIYPMPAYGKKLPPLKPYKEAECPPKDEKMDDENEKKKKDEKKRRAIDPIVYEATIDPCIDPERADRQLKARKAAKEEMERRKREEDVARANEPQTSDNNDQKT